MPQSPVSAGVLSSRSFRRRAAFAEIRTQVQFAVAEETPTSIRLRNAARHGLGRKEWMAIGCAVMVGCAVFGWARSIDRAVAEAPPATAQPTPAPVAEWTDINRPFPLYDVTGGEFAKLPMHYGARREATGLARQDILTYGSPKAGDAFLRVMFDRRTPEPRDATSLFVDMARLGGEAGLAVVRAGLSTSLNTRFGTFEVSGVSISEAGRAADCLGFRRAPSASADKLQIVGLACGGDDRVIEPAMLACTLNRIDLLSAADDADLQALFAEAERRRGAKCEQGRKGKLPASTVRQTVRTLKGSIGPVADRARPMQKNNGDE